MTVSAHARPRPAAPAPAGRRAALGALTLAGLLAGFLLLARLPLDPTAVRVGGVSLLWWYGGVAAPVLGWAVAIWACPGARTGASAGAAEATGPVASADPGR